MTDITQGSGWPPHYWPKGWLFGRSGVDEPPQIGFGGGLATLKRPKKRGLGFGRCRSGGGRATPKAFGGDSATPPNPNPFLFLVFKPFGGGRTTPKGLGWFRPPHTADLGVAQGFGGGPATPQNPNIFFLFFGHLGVVR